MRLRKSKINNQGAFPSWDSWLMKANKSLLSSSSNVGNSSLMMLLCGLYTFKIMLIIGSEHVKKLRRAISNNFIIIALYTDDEREGSKRKIDWDDKIRRGRRWWSCRWCKSHIDFFQQWAYQNKIEMKNFDSRSWSID